MRTLLFVLVFMISLTANGADLGKGIDTKEALIKNFQCNTPYAKNFVKITGISCKEMQQAVTLATEAKITNAFVGTLESEGQKPGKAPGTHLVLRARWNAATGQKELEARGEKFGPVEVFILPHPKSNKAIILVEKGTGNIVVPMTLMYEGKVAAVSGSIDESLNTIEKICQEEKARAEKGEKANATEMNKALAEIEKLRDKLEAESARTIDLVVENASLKTKIKEATEKNVATTTNVVETHDIATETIAEKTEKNSKWYANPWVLLGIAGGVAILAGGSALYFKGKANGKKEAEKKIGKVAATTGDDGNGNGSNIKGDKNVVVTVTNVNNNNTEPIVIKYDCPVTNTSQKDPPSQNIPSSAPPLKLKTNSTSSLQLETPFIDGRWGVKISFAW